MNAFLSPTTPTDALPVSIQHDSAAVGDGRRVDVTGVGAVRQDRLTRAELHALSDADLGAYIRSCIERQNQAQIRWLAGGCLADAGERDGWMLAEHEARDHRTVRAELARKGAG